MKNKMSIWAIIILVATLISLALLVVSVVTTAISVPAAMAVAKEEAIAQGASEADVQLMMSIAAGAIIVAMVFASVFDVLKIIGGFMFSLKGKWGIFCIVVSILSAVGAVWSLSSAISSKGSSVGTIISAVITLIVNVVLVVACFKHREEVQQGQ